VGRIGAYDGFTGLSHYLSGVRPPRNYLTVISLSMTATTMSPAFAATDCWITAMSTSSGPAPTIESSFAERSDPRFVALHVVVLELGGRVDVRIVEQTGLQRDGIGVDAVVLESGGDIEDV